MKKENIAKKITSREYTMKLIYKLVDNKRGRR